MGLCLAALAAAGPALACAYHPGADVSGLTARPQAVAVALAVAKARRAGLIEPRRDAAARLFGYQRLTRRLSVVSRCLADAGQVGGGFSMLVAEPGLWVRFRPGAPPALHADGPMPDAPVMTIAEAALAPLAAGELTAAAAAEAGLIVVDGDPRGDLPAQLAPCLTPAGSAKARAKYSAAVAGPSSEDPEWAQ